MIKEFFAFLKTYGVIALAIAVIIGGKLNELISSIVGDLLMPVLFQPALKAAGVDNIRALNYHGILYGKVIGSLLDFMIVAFLVFCAAKYLLRDDVIIKK